MILSKNDLYITLETEKKFYIYSRKDYIKSFLTKNERYLLWKFQKALRKAEYHNNVTKNKLLYFINIRKKDKLGIKLGISIMINTIDSGLHIYHSGNIVVSHLAKIGKNVVFHGSNCIGNNGISLEVPTIGDNCDIGFGAIVIGKIELGNNIMIGCNAVVNKSFPCNSTIVGIPARLIKKQEK
ncbi:MAG: serine acetyltransferase [Bacilli bacterium]|nr:serine acetyltransferase [Bacilli bacterium]